MEQPVESFKKLKRQSHCPYFAHISDLKKKKKDFSENPVNLAMGI